MEFSIVNVESKHAITIRDNSTAAELSNKFMELFTELGGTMKKQSLQQSGPLFGIYHGFSPEDVDVEAGAPVTGNPKAEGRVNVINTYAGKAVCLKFYGPYTKLNEGWNVMMDYIKKNNYKSSSMPFEVYVTDSGSEPDSSKWLTEIYFPI